METRDQIVRKHFQMGVNAIRDARWVDAEQAFSRVIARKPDHFLAHIYTGVAVYHQDRYSEAHAALIRAQRLDPDRFAAYQASKAIPDSDNEGRPQVDLLRDLVKNLEQCAHNLRQTAEKINDASKRQQQVIRKLHSPEPRSGPSSGVRRRRGKARKPRVSTFSGPEEAKKFRDMPPITGDDLADVDWDEVLARLLE